MKQKFNRLLFDSYDFPDEERKSSLIREITKII